MIIVRKLTSKRFPSHCNNFAAARAWPSTKNNGGPSSTIGNNNIATQLLSPITIQGRIPFRQSFATSAQKRKLQKKGYIKKRGQTGTNRSNNDVNVNDPSTRSMQSRKNSPPPAWIPMFFLGVFPLIMSFVVVISRDDLREQVLQSGATRIVGDVRRWWNHTPNEEKNDE